LRELLHERSGAASGEVRRRTPLLVLHIKSPALAGQILDEAIDTVESDASVVPDDAAPAVGVWQTGENVRVTAAPDFVGMGDLQTWNACLFWSREPTQNEVCPRSKKQNRRDLRAAPAGSCP